MRLTVKRGRRSVAFVQVRCGTSVRGQIPQSRVEWATDQRDADCGAACSDEDCSLSCAQGVRHARDLPNSTLLRLGHGLPWLMLPIPAASV